MDNLSGVFIWFNHYYGKAWEAQYAAAGRFSWNGRGTARA